MSTVTPGSARWLELVREGIIRDGNRNWYLGDAALEIAPTDGTTTNNGSDAALRQYADEVGVNVETLRNLRSLANTWRPAHRCVSASWKVHELLRTRRELIRPGMTVTQAMAALGQSTASRTGPKSSTADRIEQVREAIASDPDVAEAAQSALNHGQRQRPAAQQTNDLWEVVEAMRNASVNVSRAVQLSRSYGRLAGDMGDALSELVSITRNGCDWMDSWLTEGGFTDENLARLVGDGYK